MQDTYIFGENLKKFAYLFQFLFSHYLYLACLIKYWVFCIKKKPTTKLYKSILQRKERKIFREKKREIKEEKEREQIKD